MQIGTNQALTQLSFFIESLSTSGCGFTSQHGLVTRGRAPAGQRHAIVAKRYLVLRKAVDADQQSRYCRSC